MLLDNLPTIIERFNRVEEMLRYAPEHEKLIWMDFNEWFVLKDGIRDLREALSGIVEVVEEEQAKSGISKRMFDRIGDAKKALQRCGEKS